MASVSVARWTQVVRQTRYLGIRGDFAEMGCSDERNLSSLAGCLACPVQVGRVSLLNPYTASLVSYKSQVVEVPAALRRLYAQAARHVTRCPWQALSSASLRISNLLVSRCPAGERDGISGQGVLGKIESPGACAEEWGAPPSWRIERHLARRHPQVVAILPHDLERLTTRRG